VKTTGSQRGGEPQRNQARVRPYADPYVQLGRHIGGEEGEEEGEEYRGEGIDLEDVLGSWKMDDDVRNILYGPNSARSSVSITASQ